jgi:AraC family transcriptional regulator
MNRYTALLDTSDLAIGRFDHPGEHTHRDPAEEVAADYSVNRVERGGFEIQIGRRRWELREGDMFLTYPGMAYRCRHGERAPTDVCVAVSYLPADEDREDLAQFACAVRKRAVVPPSNRLAYLFRGFSSISLPAESPMVLEQAAGALLAEVCAERVEARKLYARHQLAWYAERVDAVRGRLEKHYALEHSLGTLARSVGISRFHFARVFGELAGMPPHRYLLRVRLNEGARKLREGASVTEACFSSGFHNLSHFIRIFQRRFGVSPAKYARQRAS